MYFQKDLFTKASGGLAWTSCYSLLMKMRQLGYSWLILPCPDPDSMLYITLILTSFLGCFKFFCLTALAFISCISCIWMALLSGHFSTNITYLNFSATWPCYLGKSLVLPCIWPTHPLTFPRLPSSSLLHKPVHTKNGRIPFQPFLFFIAARV